MKRAIFGIALAGLVLGAGPVLAQGDPTAAMTKAGCMACHTKDKKLLGPSFKVIAEKYAGQDVGAALFEKVRKGGKGVYGPIPMTPNGPEKISDEDLKAAIASILGS